jgi:DNA replication licensing factor MCM5
MSGYDEQPVFYTDQQLARASAQEPVTTIDGIQLIDNAQAKDRFKQFLREWTVNESHTYREQLRANITQGFKAVTVDMRDLFQFNAELALMLCADPSRYLPLFEDAASTVFDSLFPSNVKRDPASIQVQLVHLERKISMRDLDSASVARLVSIPGIVVSTSNVRPRARKLTIQCKTCSHVKTLDIGAGFSGVQLPRDCENSRDGQKCGLDPYTVLADVSKFQDHQTIKLQERPEHVPNGDMPRHLLASCDRNLVSKVKAGSRVEVIGIYSTFQSKKSNDDSKGSGIRQPYLQLVGIEVDSEQIINFSPEDEEHMKELSRARTADGSGGIYELLAQSIAPAIFGHEDIKKAIACQLVGGSRKFLPDGMRLRGDINVLLLGDPSVAKSQFLKFVNQVAPISVYTSGKGSSAAGLTASVIRDPASGDFHLEGGALVLGDGGIVCIDEFDKMREQDRVSIHEAMEQQTISIAKAGITTILNARSSILAAANPIHGRYDVLLTPGENITLQTTILSRFDMIFILLDRANAERDKQLSEHVLNIHKRVNNELSDKSEAPLDPDTLRKYVTYCKQAVRPRLSDEAADLLKTHYVSIRSKVKGERGDSPIPITVRQLEAIIRISESLARLELSPVSGVQHVSEAIRLFKASTLNAVESGVQIEGMSAGADRDAVSRAEEFVRSRLGIRMRTSREGLYRQYLVSVGGSDLKPLELALYGMQARQELQLVHQGRVLVRIR